MILEVSLALYAAGWNLYGQLGLGDYTQKLVFTEITVFNQMKMKQVITGYDFSLFLDVTGAVHAAGYNDFGQLGVNQSVINESKLIRVEYFVNNNITIGRIAAGIDHSLALTSDGKKLYSFGSNYYKELGRNSIERSDSVPGLVDLSNLEKDEVITELTSSFRANYLKTNKGNWYAWGWDGEHYRFPGYKINTTIDKPTKITMPFEVKQLFLGEDNIGIIDQENNLLVMGNNKRGMMCQSTKVDQEFDTFQKVNVSNVTKVVIGYFHTVILSNGIVYGCGKGDQGELGNATNKKVNTDPIIISKDVNKVVDITATWQGTFLKTENGLYSSGYNIYGEQAVNSTSTISDFASVILPNSTDSVKVVASGYRHSFLISLFEEEEEEIIVPEEQEEETYIEEEEELPVPVPEQEEEEIPVPEEEEEIVKPSNKLSGGAIAGIVIGSVAGVLIIACSVIAIIKCQKNKRVYTEINEKEKLVEK